MVYGLSQNIGWYYLLSLKIQIDCHIYDFNEKKIWRFRGKSRMIGWYFVSKYQLKETRLTILRLLVFIVSPVVINIEIMTYIFLY